MKTVKTIGVFLIFYFMNQCYLLANENTTQIREIIKETQVLCESDNGLLWGRSLDVPLLFVDQANKRIYSNTPSESLNLDEENGVFVGVLQASLKVIKGPVMIDRKNWALIPLPLPKDKTERQSIILHEAFHCLQPKLDLKPEPYNNSHLEKMEARFWLKLEWKALELALQTTGENRTQAITDAICFRKYRRALFSKCDSCENRFEIHEGMADYTANKICRTNSDLKDYLLSKLGKMWESTSYADCFAYYTGPVYAFLLDEIDYNWRNDLGTNDNIAMIVKTAYEISLPFDLYMEAEERSVLYSGAQIMGEELDRELTL